MVEGEGCFEECAKGQYMFLSYLLVNIWACVPYPDSAAYYFSKKNISRQAWFWLGSEIALLTFCRIGNLPTHESRLETMACCFSL
jgi:hypothetical protein